MPPTQRRHEVGVIDRLLATPQQFDFFQAVRLLDRWMDSGSHEGRGLNRVRFRNSLSLAFPASEIESLRVHWRMPSLEQAVGARIRPSDIARVELTPAFMGLLGLTGAMPLYYTEALQQRELYKKDEAARAFMDVFSHRAVALFYDAWRKNRLVLQYEADQSKALLPMTLSLAGMGQHQASGSLRVQARRTAGVSRESLAYFSGSIQQRTWSVAQIQCLLQGHLRLPVRIEQFVGRWYSLPEAGRSYLGVHHAANKMLGTLGHSAVLGERVWQRDLCIRVVLGPLTQAQLMRFLPASEGAQTLQTLLTMCCGHGLEFEINLQLQQGHVRDCQLDGERAAVAGRLGWDTFLQSRPPQGDRVDVRYDLPALA